MPATFPTLQASGSAAAVSMYGLQRSNEFRTVVNEFTDSTEQRWASRIGLARFTLNLNGINGYDLSRVRAFFNSTKGGFDSTWTIVVNGVTYQNMAFMDDTFPITDPPKTLRYSLSLKLIQTIA